MKIFVDERLTCFGGGGARAEAYSLQLKAIGRAVVVVREKGCLDAANMTLEMLTSTLPKIALK